MPTIDDITPTIYDPKATPSIDYVNGWQGGIVGSIALPPTYYRVPPDKIYLNKTATTRTKTYSNLKAGDILKLTVSGIDHCDFEISYTQNNNTSTKQFYLANSTDTTFSDLVTLLGSSITISIKVINLNPYRNVRSEDITSDGIGSSDVSVRNSNPFFTYGARSDNLSAGYSFTDNSLLTNLAIQSSSKTSFWANRPYYPALGQLGGQLPYFVTLTTNGSVRGLRLITKGLKQNTLYKVIAHQLLPTQSQTVRKIDVSIKSYPSNVTLGSGQLVGDENAAIYDGVVFGPITSDQAVTISLTPEISALFPATPGTTPVTPDIYLAGVIVGEIVPSATYNPYILSPTIRTIVSSAKPPTVTPSLLTGYNNTPPVKVHDAIIRPGDSVSRAPWFHYGFKQESLGVITGIFKDKDDDIVALCPIQPLSGPNVPSIGSIVYRPASYDSSNSDFSYQGFTDSKEFMSKCPYIGVIKHSIPTVSYNPDPKITGYYSYFNADGVTYTSTSDYCIVKIHPYFLKHGLIDPRYDGKYLKADSAGNIIRSSAYLSDDNYRAAVSGGYLSSKFGIDRIPTFKSDGVQFSSYSGISGTLIPTATGPLFDGLSDAKKLLRLQHIRAWGNAVPITVYGRIIKSGYYTFVLGQTTSPDADQEYKNYAANPPYKNIANQDFNVYQYTNNIQLDDFDTTSDRRATTPLTVASLPSDINWYVESLINYTSNINDLAAFVPSYWSSPGNRGAMILDSDNCVFTPTSWNSINGGYIQIINQYGLKALVI